MFTEITSTGWSRQNLIGGIASLQRQRSGQLADGWLTAIGGAVGTEPTAEAIKKKGRLRFANKETCCWSTN